jgi:hypothetical protein
MNGYPAFASPDGSGKIAAVGKFRFAPGKLGKK